MLLCMSYFPMILSALVHFPCCSSAFSLMNEREVHVIVLHFLWSTLPTSSLKEVTRYMLMHTSHDLAVSLSSLNLQTIEVSAAHIMVDLTYCCTALQNYV